MAARPAVPTESAWRKLRGAWSGGKQVGHDASQWDYGVDDRRGWIIGMAWLVAAAVEWVGSRAD